MSDNHNYCVIMAGGWGTRFWPISRSSKPKQFLDLGMVGKSILRQTWERFSRVVPKENIIVVSLKAYESLVYEDIPELDPENLFLEPHNRNTAPCLAFAAYKLVKRDPEAVIVATPADHMISGDVEFVSAVGAAMDFVACGDRVATIGIVPTRPDPNFGYIQTSGDLSSSEPLRTKTFIEKPDKELAEVLLASGEFLWNSGISVWKVSTLLGELKSFAPEITNLWSGWETFVGCFTEDAEVSRIYSEVPRISIDYAVLEKTGKAWVIPARFEWADIGNWESLYQYLSVHDENGNTTRVAGKLLSKDCRNDIIYAKGSKKLVAVRGLEDYVIIDSDDVLMICPREESKLKDFISELALPGFEDYR